MPAADALPHVQIYTDGGCDPNPGPGGWGAILLSGANSKEISGAEATTTNNRMELTAALSALRLLSRACRITLFTDSQYLCRSMTTWVRGWEARGWRRANGAPVENQDLLEKLVAEAARHEIEWRWLRGHTGHRLNERADHLATRARERLVAVGWPPHEEVLAAQRPPASSEHLDTVEIYARGCSLGASGPGGYAAILVRSDAEEETASGGWPVTTSNAMQLWAAIVGLQGLRQPSRVMIHTPSQYVLQGATQWLGRWERSGWRTKDGGQVKHREIWEELAHVMGDHDIQWVLLRGNTDPHATRAARLARDEAERQSTRSSRRISRSD